MPQADLIPELLAALVTQIEDLKRFYSQSPRLEAVVAAHIGDPTVGLFPYRAGSRPCSREDHLQRVTRHLAGHLKDLKKTVSR